jgi:hypothetical protein
LRADRKDALAEMIVGRIIRAIIIDFDIEA